MNIKDIKENSDIAKSKIVSLDNGCLSYLDFSDVLNTILSEAIQTDDMPVRAYSYIHDSLNSCVESGDFTILDATGTAYTDLDFSAIGRIKLSKKNMSGYPLGEWLDLIAKPEYMVYMYKKEYPDDFAILKLSNKTDIVCGVENYSQYNAVVREASGKIENGKEYLFYVLFIPTIAAETDPTVPAHVKAIQTTDITNWNNKVGTETDPTVPAHVKAITTQQIQGWNNGIYIKNNNLIIPAGGHFINNLNLGTTVGATKISLKVRNDTSPIKNSYIFAEVGDFSTPFLDIGAIEPNSFLSFVRLFGIISIEKKQNVAGSGMTDFVVVFDSGMGFSSGIGNTYAINIDVQGTAGAVGEILPYTLINKDFDGFTFRIKENSSVNQQITGIRVLCINPLINSGVSVINEDFFLKNASGNYYLENNYVISSGNEVLSANLIIGNGPDVGTYKIL